MSKSKLIQSLLFILAFTWASLSYGVIGIITIALGEMDENIGRIQVPFAADALIETEEFTLNSRINYSPGKVRDALVMGGNEMVTIRRLDLGKVWLMLGPNMYREIEANSDAQQAPDYKLISREKLGKETVNGIATTKYKSVYQSSEGKFGGFTWFTDDHIAVKGFLVQESGGKKHRIKFEFTSLERGTQEPELFELPPGAQPLNMGSFGGMPNFGNKQR